MKKIILLSCFVLLACALDTLSFQSERIDLGANGHTLFRFDATIEGAIFRLARLELDKVFAELPLHDLPATIALKSKNKLVRDKVVELCRFSFECELDGDKLKVAKKEFVDPGYYREKEDNSNNTFIVVDNLDENWPWSIPKPKWQTLELRSDPRLIKA